MTSRRTMPVPALICALLACVLALAGCSASSSTPTHQTSPGTPAVHVPASAEAHSVAGAEAFARFWVSTLNQATTSGNTKALLALSGPHCAVCKDFAHHLTSIYSAGGKVETQGWQVTNVIPIAGQSLKHPGFQVYANVSPQKVWVSKSAKPKSYQGGHQGMRIFLMRSGDRWLVQNIEIAQGS